MTTRSVERAGVAPSAAAAAAAAAVQAGTHKLNQACAARGFLPIKHALIADWLCNRSVARVPRLARRGAQQVVSGAAGVAHPSGLIVQKYVPGINQVQQLVRSTSTIQQTAGEKGMNNRRSPFCRGLALCNRSCTDCSLGEAHSKQSRAEVAPSLQASNTYSSSSSSRMERQLRFHTAPLCLKCKDRFNINIKDKTILIFPD